MNSSGYQQSSSLVSVASIPAGNGRALGRSAVRQVIPACQDSHFARTRMWHSLRNAQGGASEFKWYSAMAKQHHMRQGNHAAEEVELSVRSSLNRDEAALPKAKSTSRLILPTAEGLLYLPHRTVVLLTADGSYTRLHLDDGRTLLVSKGLGMLHRCLPPALFHRCHDSHVVNLAHVIRLLRQGGSRAELTGGLEVPVARRRLSGFSSAMESLRT